jgi:hypothetical protein
VKRIGIANDGWGIWFRGLDWLLLRSPVVSAVIPLRARMWLLTVKEPWHERVYNRGLTNYLPVSRMSPDDLVS